MVLTIDFGEVIWPLPTRSRQHLRTLPSERADLLQSRMPKVRGNHHGVLIEACSKFAGRHETFGGLQHHPCP